MAEEEYDVGYKKPPKHTQFKPGQSGNPKGRQKGARGLKTDLREELNERITITENGKAVKLTKQQVMMKQLSQQAMKGNIRAIALLTDLAAKVLGTDDEVPASEASLSVTDEDILREFLKKNAGGDFDE
ncbi:MAG: DUF5681 domain-containing protein [Pseudomonadota bacterium]